MSNQQNDESPRNPRVRKPGTRVIASRVEPKPSSRIEVTVQTWPENRNNSRIHQFEFNRLREIQDPDGEYDYQVQFFEWKPSSRWLLYDDILAFVHAEQYLRLHGIHLEQYFHDEMYRPSPEAWITDDVELNLDVLE